MHEAAEYIAPETRSPSARGHSDAELECYAAMGAAIDKRIAGFEKQEQERANPLLAAHFRENFELEFAPAAASRYRGNTGRRLPKGEAWTAESR